MTEEYSKSLLRICVGQICQGIGWTSIQATPLEVITDIGAEYIKTLARRAHNYAELYNQTQPNLNHVDLAFKDMGICLNGLEDYVKNFENPLSLEVPKFPIPQDSHLNFLKPGSREVLTRPVHIHEHLPPMHPHLEDGNYPMKPSPGSVEGNVTGDTISPLSSPKPNVFKRPGDPVTDVKRLRTIMEEEVRPLREISSVMMTTSGFLSPAREGKLPEARTPVIPAIDSGLTSDCPESSHTENKERKKKRHLNDSVILKKNEKENKAKEETPCDNYEPKTKKLASVKETNKLKALKSGAVKMISQPSLSSVTPSSIKQSKQAAQKSKPHTITMQEIGSSRALKTSHFLPSKTDVSADQRSDSVGFSMDEKLPSEPDKQKLNIFRKISKVKEEPQDVLLFKKEPEEPVDTQWSQIDHTIEAVIQDSKIAIKEELDIKEEHIDVEGIGSPPHFDTLSYPDDQSLPGTPTTPRTPDLPRVIEHKKKKKEKHKEKREMKDKHNHSPKILSKYTSDPEFNSLLTKPKTPEVDMTSDEVTLPPVFPLFPSFSTCPGLIPPSVFMQHLPQARMKNPTTNNVSNNTSADPSQQDSAIQITPGSNNVASTSLTNPLIPPQLPSQKVAETLLITQKKKEHKKEKKVKDKIKKKKDKKTKSKDKSEKKKIKLEKKEREKEKSKSKKEKKEKKKEKEASEDNIEGQSGGLPKITLKFGPVSPQDTTDTGVRKIVIKPLLKKEEDVSAKVERSHSPELAKISPLVPRPSKHKSRNYTSGFSEEMNRPSLSSSQTSTANNEKSEVPVAVRLDNEGNEVWICPACGRQDDGSPMIGCDGCDAWYHWVCVGIQVPPDSSEWFCRLCVSRKMQDTSDKKKKNRKKKMQH